MRRYGWSGETCSRFEVGAKVTFLEHQGLIFGKLVSPSHYGSGWWNVVWHWNSKPAQVWVTSNSEDQMKLYDWS